jgi:hypothetical protein
MRISVDLLAGESHTIRPDYCHPQSHPIVGKLLTVDQEGLTFAGGLTDDVARRGLLNELLPIKSFQFVKVSSFVRLIVSLAGASV